MPELRIASTYDPQPRQIAFHTSKARVRAYGGAMGGGKTRALCEDVFQDMLDNPGIQIPVFRLRHVSITETTKRTMVQEVIPPELLRHCDRKQSGGEDYIRLPNGSTVHFAGLDDPIRWFSSELGGLAFDEAHEIPEDSVLKLMTRLRQRGVDADGVAFDMPCRVRLCFNPENPGHWLHRWFISDADRIDMPDGSLLSWRKSELFPTDATKSLGAAEFIFAPPDSNKYLPEGYVENTLGGLPELLRRRYMDGEWLFTSGSSYFDVEGMTHYAVASKLPPKLFRFDWQSVGYGNQARMRRHPEGRIHVYAEPAEGHRYAIAADPASGSGRDSSAVFVIDLQSMEFVAEFHGKLDEDQLAEQLHFLGRWYEHDGRPALVGVEHQGGMGNATILNLRDGKGGRPPYPNLYRHKLELQVDLATTKRWGFPISMQTRVMILSGLAAEIREQTLPFMTSTLLDQCATFVNHESGTSPRAQEGCRDDAVMAAALALELYRMRGRHPDRERRIEDQRLRKPKRERKAAFPWLRT